MSLCHLRVSLNDGNLIHLGTNAFIIFFQKRKTLRASLAMQRQYNVGLNTSNPGTISFAVDNHRYPRIAQQRGPERAWPGETDAVLRNRRLENDSNKFRKPPPPGWNYTAGYTTDVSHLIV